MSTSDGQQVVTDLDPMVDDVIEEDTNP